MKMQDVKRRALRSVAAFAIVVASMGTAFTAFGDTVAWWHFDEADPGTVAAANTITAGTDPEAYAEVYSLEAHNPKTSGDYLPSYAKPFHGLCVCDPVSGAKRTNRSAMKFATTSKDGSPAYYAGCLVVRTGNGQMNRCVSSLTVEAFVCTTGGTFSTFAPIVGNLDSYNYMTENWAVYMLDDGTLALRFAGNVWYTGDSQVGTAKINDGAWHHVAVTWNGSVIKIYVDYEQDKFKSGNPRQFSHTSALGYASNNSTRFGGYTGAADNVTAQRRFNGLVDEVRISDVALLPNQFLRMQPVDMDPDEVLRISFDKGEYGVLNAEMNLSDSLGPNCPKALFKTTGGAASYDSADKAGGTVGAGRESSALQNASSLRLSTNGTMSSGCYVQVPGFSSRFVGNPSTNYTIECFYKSGGQVRGPTANRQSIFKFGAGEWIASAMLCAQYPSGSGEMGDGYMFISYKDKVLEDSNSPDPHRYEVTLDKQLDDGCWHHVAIVADGDGMEARTYIDGRLSVRRTGYVPAPDLGYASSLFIGSAWEGSGPARFFDGWIDNMRVTMRALQPSEFMTPNPVDSGDASLFASFEQNYSFACAADADLSVTGYGESRNGGNEPSFVMDSRGPLLLGGEGSTERTANEWSVSLDASRVVFPPSPLFESASCTIEFLAKFDGIKDGNGSVSAGSTDLAQNVPIMRLVAVDGSGFDWYAYRSKDRDNAIEMSINGYSLSWTMPGNGKVVDGRWHHYAFLFESVENETRTRITLFRDYADCGSLEANRTIPRRVAGHRLMIGEGTFDHPNMTGKFDALRFTRGILDVSQFIRKSPVGLAVVFR